MTFPVEFRMAADALFPVKIDSATVEVPDVFNPQIGDHFVVDYVRPRSGAMDGSQEVASTTLFAEHVEWGLRVARGHGPTSAHPKHEIVMRVTLSSEVPSVRQSRHPHDDTAGTKPPRRAPGRQK